MPEGSQQAFEIALTHFVVSDDVARSRHFYTEVLGGTLIRPGEPTYVALANSWIIINAGGGPTDDKPAVTLDAARSGSGEQLPQHPGLRHPRRICGVERSGRRVPHPAETARNRDPLLSA